MRDDIDVTFDFRSDTPPDKDPDIFSPTLHRYHQLLWSKPLPCGTRFDLRDARPRGYLHHRSDLGEFFLSSDSVVPSFRKETRLASVFAEIPAEARAEFVGATYTIGGMMIFPGNVIERKMTINGARGFHPRIKDRFDLTIECIRLHYRRERSPLADALSRYASFFALFESFRGYINFFLLQDIVTDDYSAVRFHAPFTGIDQSPLPTSLDAYLAYRRLAMQFLAARNQRIRESVALGA
ncbi:MAG: hypothetical protein M3Y05_00935 [Gemmatimonadota bacterium]|nr:hypothetical protein [Gemmatimonadota bacterium]